MLAWWNKFFPKSDQRARERAVPGNTILEAEVIRSLLCLKPVQIWISLFNDQEIADKYQRRGPSAPGSAGSSLCPPLSSPDGAGGAACGQEGAARGCGQWPGRAGCWHSSCPWCPGTPCPGRPAWSWRGSGQNYWRVRFQVHSGPDLPSISWVLHVILSCTF